MLKPLPISSRPWIDVTLDFVTGLPISNSYNAILMVVDRLTKERHYIPCTTDENGTTTEATAQLLLQNVWKLHGLPSSLISDRGCNNVTLGAEGSQSGSHVTTIIQNFTLVSLTSTITPHRVWLLFGASGPFLDLRTRSLLTLRT